MRTRLVYESYFLNEFLDFWLYLVTTVKYFSKRKTQTRQDKKIVPCYCFKLSCIVLR